MHQYQYTLVRGFLPEPWKFQADIGDWYWWILILVTSFESWCPTIMLKDKGCWWRKRSKPSPTSQKCLQHISSPTSVTNIDAAKLTYVERPFDRRQFLQRDPQTSSGSRMEQKRSLSAQMPKDPQRHHQLFFDSHTRDLFHFWSSWNFYHRHDSWNDAHKNKIFEYLDLPFYTFVYIKASWTLATFETAFRIDAFAIIFTIHFWLIAECLTSRFILFAFIYVFETFDQVKKYHNVNANIFISMFEVLTENNERSVFQECWGSSMLETKYVDDRFEMLVTDLINTLKKSTTQRKSPTKWLCYQHLIGHRNKVTNIPLSPASLSPNFVRTFLHNY